MAFCLEHGVWPWMRLGQTLVVATAAPDEFKSIAEEIEFNAGDILMGVATADDIERAIAAQCGAQMATQAEIDLPSEESCRGMHVVASKKHMALVTLCVAFLSCGIFVVPEAFFIALGAWVILSLMLMAAMKFMALIAKLMTPQVVPKFRPLEDAHPKVSLLVPLFREKDIAGALVERLSKLAYAKSRLEVLLVLEAEDQQTKEKLDNIVLPPWMRIVIVPPGSLTTKPRAMNYARRFATGDIVGIYDAEDAPAPDQIETVVAHFRDAPKCVGCVQGILDFYNPTMNWLARCFTIEYAAWFRVLLPGLARMGFPIPLGGTTVFFRREVLDELNGWDAHNVTEDADLGIRLARKGYRTDILSTVTLEEANCRTWPWIRQRSRWLKGYFVTYRTHMRSPRELLKDLGWRGFLGFQVFFLGSLSQFALAPVLWSFWVVPFGIPHPILEALPDGWFQGVVTTFIASEVIGLFVGMSAVASPRHRKLIPWVPTLMFYFPLGVVAMYKAMWEALYKPFFWDKTSHGHAKDHTTISH
ncbi:MAG: glycosyltransferase [Marinovum sp.]|nr:glycosyltransferase [Marinovum sp.]